MKLRNLLIGLEGIKARGDLDVEIREIQNDSRKVEHGDLFVAIKGYVSDGHKYVEQAIQSGAVAVMVEEGCINLNEVAIPQEVTIIMLPNTRRGLAIASTNYYGHPSKEFKLIGVTGTKGKTTTTFMIKEMLEKSGKKVGLIGTIAIYINGKEIRESDRTTPESIEIQKLFRTMADEGVEYVIMEVSSQSLKLNRVDGCEFDLCVFTNLSKDHISEREHPDMQDYFNSKLKLFEMCKTGIVNTDDLYGAKIPNMFPDNDITTYGIDNYANLLAKDITITNSYVDFKVKLTNRNERVKVGIPGRFSVYNSLAAIVIAKKYGIDSEIIKQALLEVRVPGRSEMIDNKLEIPVMVDFAHTPESLQNILQAVKSYTQGKVISVFGCGGDRDHGKRPLMGEISGKVADYSIITSDNPRTEEPESIVAQIEEGIKKTKGKYEVICDRKQAIEAAMKMATKRDIVVISGKGHESYMEINGKKYPYSERETVEQIAEKLAKK